MSVSIPRARKQAGAGAARGLAPALLDLERALHEPGEGGAAHGSWRWTVRQRMAAVRDELLGEDERSEDGWLAARSGGILRERDALLARLSALGPQVLESPDVERLRTALTRLLTDIAHHVQRVHDLAYDAVELELGGSE
ncbi:hypothetical protein GCM10009844_10230 [Nocardioides koreensis]|uniref:DUF4254 domain-containing protein n=1 Tax=Nocardioides koreensis TaxID=433651 RepID=A0ABP5L1N1_9ACTN